MQALRSTQHGGKSLDRHAHNIILRLLRGETDSRGLSVKTQQPGTWVFCLERLAHLTRPNATGGAILGDLFEEVIVRIEEEGKTRRELVHVHAARNTPPDVFESVAQGECQFLCGCRSRFTDVISADRNCVPLRYFLRTEFH